MENIVIIPARYSSTRLPGKLLLDLSGKTVIQRTFEQASLSKKADKVFIATDSELIVKECRKFTDNIILTICNHENGTSRIIEALSSVSDTFVNIVNVQGDEPFIEADLIDEIFEELEENNPVVSAYHCIDYDEAKSPHNVKVVLNNNSEAIYFSRSLIPFSFNINEKSVYLKHIGIYGYKKSVLNKLGKLKSAEFIEKERLEQLIFINNKIDIKMIYTDYTPIGIDVIEDYEKAKILVSKQEY